MTFQGIRIVEDQSLPADSFKLVATRREGLETVTQEVGYKDGQIYETTRHELLRVLKRSVDEK